MKLTVVTWNIHKGVGGVDRRYSLDRIVELLGAYEPDVVLLQEVVDHMSVAGYDYQPEKLAHGLGMRHFAFRPEYRYRVGGYGNAILSRWPLTDVHHVDLTIGRRKKRGVLQAKSRVRVGKRSRTIFFHNMHLGLAGSERGRQLERFLDSHPFARLHERTPIVVAGDLNDVWGSLGPRYLTPAGFRRAGKLVNTFPAVMPVRPLDGVFVRGDLDALDCSCPRTDLARQASDHRPLVVKLNLRMGQQ